MSTKGVYKHALAAAGGIGIALLLVGCSVDAFNPSGLSSASTATSELPPPSASDDTAASTGGASDPHEESGPHDHDAEIDANAEVGTTELATRAVTLFCRPAIDYDTWIAELYPVLSQQAAVAYETVDPANVPCTTLTGTAQVRDGDGTHTMRVLVPTDGGDYTVYVHRPNLVDPWAVESITPLASE